MLPASLLTGVRQRLRTGSFKTIAWSFGAGVLTRAGLLVLAIILARQLGPADYGTFTFTTGVAGVLAQFTSLGWPTLMNRLIPTFVREQDWSRLRGLVRAGDVVVIGASLIGALVLVMLSPLAGDLAHGFVLSAVLLPPFALAILRRQQLAAVRRSAWGLLFDQGFGAILVAACLLILATMPLDGVIWAFSGATLAGALIATLLFRARLPSETRRAAPVIQWGAWSAMALPMIIGLSSKLLMNKTDILLLAPLSDLEQTGLYGAAFRITYLLTFPQVVLMTVVTPMFGEAFASNRTGHARRVLRMANIYGLVTTLPVVVPILFAAPWVMETVFGPAFGEGGTALAILTLAQLAAALTLPFSAILMMGGREKAFGALNLVVLLMNAAVCVIAIPRLGAAGAALATLLSATVLLLAQVWLSRPLLKAREA